jgi:uncharacterized delta-60 repeat protein
LEEREIYNLEMETTAMFFPRRTVEIDCGSKLHRTAQAGRRFRQGRRPRSFCGQFERLEVRTVLSFGTGGIVTTAVNGGSQAFAVAIQPADQKIVVGGDTGRVENGEFALARYNTDGTLDSTFGTNGVVITPFSTALGNPQVNSLAVQPSNGAIVAGGADFYFVKKTLSYDSEFALARYTTSGSLDTTFGTSGEVTTTFPAADGEVNLNTVLLTSNGEILAVGAANYNNTGAGSSVALTLYTSTGALDKGFGSSGTVVDTSLNTSSSAANSYGGITTVYQYFDPASGVLESDNSVLVAGSYVTDTKVTNSSGTVLSWTTNDSDLALVHYLADGAGDMSFGTNGIVITPITPPGVTTSNAWGTDVLVQPNGAIVEAGRAVGSSGYNDILVARYNANGTADTSFGGVGDVLVDLGSSAGYSGGATVALQPNGQIVAAGSVATGSAPLTYGFATVRLNTDGSLDTSFGTGGTVVTQVLYDDPDSNAVALETVNSETMIVDAATAEDASNNQYFALARYTPNGNPDAGVLVTRQPPASVTAGSVFGLTVEAEDSSGNLLSSFNGTMTVALANNPTGATLGGTLTATASNGVATFSDLSLTTAASGNTLDVSASGLGEDVTSAITVTPAAAAQVAITTEPPASVTAGSSFGLQATIEDQFGNVETGDNTDVAATALAGNPGGATLGGTLLATASNGVATFSGLTLIEAAAGYTVAVSSGVLSSSTSSAITVTPGVATQAVITGQPPASVVVKASFGLIAAIEDAYGNVEISSSGTVKVALDNNPGGSKLGGTLSVKASNGMATFSALTLNKVGTGYTLELTSSGLTGAVTNSITVTSNSTDVVVSAPAGTCAPDALLAPLVLDSPGFLDSLGLKQRPRSI